MFLTMSTTSGTSLQWTPERIADNRRFPAIFRRHSSTTLEPGPEVETDKPFGLKEEFTRDKLGEGRNAEMLEHLNLVDVSGGRTKPKDCLSRSDALSIESEVT
ncbi:hypothetical protein T265_11019 [Opisthorchis viverrini]|uniref:Uncharacterized protein n=1 Tax=Opisthorchis viverrini TaxID=6198 RepID=A0A074Z4I3_OPIVI|nr:hypothetical protein T265_11019 [Opisthorchis viverrini]KER20437.1 hypothetical protein T265_11019 [Opisthorchis viverrini]